VPDAPTELGFEQPFENPESVGELAELYLGNILYALELAALWLEGEGRAADAPFYRGIARKLAEAHGAARKRGAGPGAGGEPPR
jgi:hypothetical protein